MSPVGCYICALVTGIALLLHGCGSDGGGDGPVFTECEAAKFKTAGEPCYNAIELEADKCTGIMTEMSKCYEKAKAAGGDCFKIEDTKWISEIVDKKFAAAKEKFTASSGPCLKAATFEQKCDSEKNQEAEEACWKPAEEAAGGKWEKQGDFVISECPYYWIIESMIASQAEHSKWYETTCMKP